MYGGCGNVIFGNINVVVVCGIDVVDVHRVAGCIGRRGLDVGHIIHGRGIKLLGNGVLLLFRRNKADGCIGPVSGKYISAGIVHIRRGIYFIPQCFELL